MSTLTKIFIVLVMVLAVTLVALIVPFAVNTDNYRQQLADARGQVEIANRNAAAREADLSRITDRMQQEKYQLRQQISSLETDLASQNRQLSEQQRTIAQLRSEKLAVDAQLERLSSGLQQAAQVNALLQDEVRERRDGQLRLQTQAIELGDELRASTAQIDTLSRQIRLLREQNHELTQQNEDLTAQVQMFAMPEADELLEVGFDPRQVIRGDVTGVDQSGDHTFVAINVGRNDTVREGMRFTIHRENQYLGDIVITQVDQNSAAGRVVLQRQEITDGAQVVAGLR